MINGINWFHYPHVYDDIAKRLKDGDIFVEIGSLYGESTVYMAKLLKSLGKKVTIYAIDKWEVDQTSEDYMKQNIDNDSFFNKFLFNIEYNKVDDMIIPVRGDSSSMAVLFKDNSINAIMFDGDHRYEGLEKDFRAYLPKLAPGAFVVGDDYNHPTFPGITRFVDQFGKDNFSTVLSTDTLSGHSIWTMEIAS